MKRNINFLNYSRVFRGITECKLMLFELMVFAHFCLQIFKDINKISIGIFNAKKTQKL